MKVRSRMTVVGLASLALIAAIGETRSAYAESGLDQPPRVDLQAPAAAKQLTINQVDTSLFPKVSIFATVLENGQPVSGLSAKDFRVREDEVDQEPLTVIPRLSPLSVVVTLDTSGSMSKAIARKIANSPVGSMAAISAHVFDRNLCLA